MSLLVVMDITKSDSFIKAYTGRQGEKSDTIQFKLYENGVNINNEIQSAKLRAETPLGHYIEKTLKKGIGVWELTTDENMNAEVGYYKRFYVEATLKDKVMTSPDVIYLVLPDANITAGNANDYISRVEEIIKAIEQDYDAYIKAIDKKYNEAVLNLTNEFEKAKGELLKEVGDFKTKVLNDYAELTVKFDKFKKDVDAKLLDLTTRFATLNENMTQLNKDMDALKAKMDDLVAKGAITQTQADARYMRWNKADVVEQDWNTLNVIGTYHVGKATGENRPPAFEWGTLLVQGTGDSITQLAINASMMFFRRKTSKATWGRWNKVGDNVDPKIFMRTWDELVTNETTFGSFIKQGTFPVCLVNEDQPADSPLAGQVFDVAVGWLEVNHPQLGGDKTSFVMQKVYFPDLKKAFQRIQTGDVPEGQTNLVWGNWSSLGGGEPASVEDIIIGERDDVVVTPKALKEATESTVPFKEWFGTGTPVENQTNIEYLPIPLGKSLGVSPNGESKRPYTINSDGTLTLTREATLDFDLTFKSVVGSTGTFPIYQYMYISDPNKRPSGWAADQLEIVSLGSTRATNGVLNYNWITSGKRTLTLPKGHIISPTIRQPAGSAFRMIRVQNLVIEEVPAPNTKGLNISALADNPVIPLEDLLSFTKDNGTTVTDWTPIVLDATTESAENTVPSYRVITYTTNGVSKRKVEFKGAIRSSSTHNLPSSGSSLVISTLPEDVRPSTTAIVLCASNDLNVGVRVAVTSSGGMGVGNNSGKALEYGYISGLYYWLD